MKLFTRKPMICRAAVEAVTAYLEGSMPARERTRFESHLAACPHCRVYLEQIRATIAVTGAIEADDLSAGAQAALQDVFAAWAAERP